MFLVVLYVKSFTCCILSPAAVFPFLFLGQGILLFHYESLTLKTKFFPLKREGVCSKKRIYEWLNELFYNFDFTSFKPWVFVFANICKTSKYIQISYNNTSRKRGRILFSFLVYWLWLIRFKLYFLYYSFPGIGPEIPNPYNRVLQSGIPYAVTLYKAFNFQFRYQQIFLIVPISGLV